MVRALVGSLIAVGEGRQPTTWPAEVMAGRRRDAGRARRARARADARGGRLSRRTPSWLAQVRSGRASQEGRRIDAPEHYFSADPSVPFEARAASRPSCGVIGSTFDSGSGVFSRGHPRPCDRRAVPRGPASAAGTVPRPGVRLRRHRARAGPGRAAGQRHRRRRQRARDPAGQRQRACSRPRPALRRVPARAGRRATRSFDEIWSNPPIRIGKEALHDLLLTWLPRLAPGGRMVMVVGKNLGADSLQRWLGEQGWPSSAAGQPQGLPGAGDAARLTAGRLVR